MNTFILHATTVLIAGIFAAKIAERLKIPDVALLLAFGVVLGPEALGVLPKTALNAVGDTIRELAIIIIVFDAGYHLSWGALKKAWFEVTKFVTAGCVYIMAFAAFFAHILFGIPYSVAFLFGAIMSTTDPTAVFSLFRDAKVPVKLRNTLQAESIGNDPTAIVLAYFVLDYIASAAGGVSIKYTQIIWVVFLALAVGVAGGTISRVIMEHLVKSYSTLLSLSLAMATYVVASALDGSAILAVATAGVMLGHAKLRDKRAIIQFDDELALLMKIIIFMYLGAIVEFGGIAGALVPGILFALALIFIGRPTMILLLASPKKFTLKERLYMGLVGLYGVVPAALAPLLLKFPGGGVMVGAVFITILVSLVVVGGLLKKYNKALLGAK